MTTAPSLSDPPIAIEGHSGNDRLLATVGGAERLSCPVRVDRSDRNRSVDGDGRSRALLDGARSWWQYVSKSFGRRTGRQP